ncbi:hypothetical protein DFH07DRAFT_943931 [Mycena maculata]|uniref:Uncharacterized protein n=1 Tax=Mycena maculata TaxID=230809 RepID=A0AAD7MZ53_9AGAR|nr:hypothetical protein DFH07DRAFT_943931 [Mycena maculata]
MTASLTSCLLLRLRLTSVAALFASPQASPQVSKKITRKPASPCFRGTSWTSQHCSAPRTYISYSDPANTSTDTELIAALQRAWLTVHYVLHGAFAVVVNSSIQNTNCNHGTAATATQPTAMSRLPPLINPNAPPQGAESAAAAECMIAQCALLLHTLNFASNLIHAAHPCLSKTAAGGPGTMVGAGGGGGGFDGASNPNDVLPVVWITPFPWARAARSWRRREHHPDMGDNGGAEGRHLDGRPVAVSALKLQINRSMAGEAEGKELGLPPVAVAATAVDSTAVFLLPEASTGWDGRRDGRGGRFDG